jgi:catechol 2,3-dioxygenase-like lactoylglutathione lyase family enzyme
MVRDHPRRFGFFAIPPFNVTRASHAVLKATARDLDLTQAFYCDVLGLVLSRRAEGGHKTDRAIWRVARSIFVSDDSGVAKSYGGDDPNSPCRFYMRQLMMKLARGKKARRLQEPSRHAGRGRDARLRDRQCGHPRHRERGHRSNPRHARNRRRIRHLALLRQGLDRPGAGPPLHGTDGGKGDAGGQRGARAQGTRRSGAGRRRSTGRAVPRTRARSVVKASCLQGCSLSSPPFRTRARPSRRIGPAKSRGNAGHNGGATEGRHRGGERRDRKAARLRAATRMAGQRRSRRRPPSIRSWR